MLTQNDQVITQRWKEDLALSIIARLRESYPFLTVEYVSQRIERLIEGGQPENAIDRAINEEIRK